MSNPNAYRFKYCPQCGKETLTGKSVKSFECGRCGLTFYMNTAASVTALIYDSEERLLVVIRKHDPVKGTWDLPGGFVDPYETAEEAIKREVYEELRLDVIDTNYIGTYPNTYEFKGISYTTLDMLFRCSVKGFESLKASDDAEAYLFCERDKLNPDKFGLDSMKKIVADILNKKLTDPGSI